MPYFIVLLLTPICVAIALHRRFPDGPTEDAPLRLLRWTAGLVSPQRAEFGELAHLDGRWARLRFALGRTGAAACCGIDATSTDPALVEAWCRQAGERAVTEARLQLAELIELVEDRTHRVTSTFLNCHTPNEAARRELLDFLAPPSTRDWRPATHHEPQRSSSARPPHQLNEEVAAHLDKVARKASGTRDQEERAISL
ncbi:DUF6331 family protein [Dactylosporangium sp. CA-152071]|uniref:DUF6331 family protein n=1 Tax=Dactylosporangium sp. CA-152071 TaxID=3239933 RepID=UPI003D926D36